MPSAGGWGVSTPVQADGSTLQLVGGTLAVKDDGITPTQLGGNAGTWPRRLAFAATFTAGTTRYTSLPFTADSSNETVNATETAIDSEIPKAAEVVAVQVRCTSNAATGDSFVRLRKNAATVGTAITIPAGATGFFQMTGLPVSFAALDLGGFQVICGAAGNIGLEVIILWRAD